MKLNSRIIPLLILASFIFLSGCTFPEVPVCGNNICEAPTENSNTCAVDCSGTPQPENRYYEGKFIKNLEGTGTYTGQEMSVKLTTILQSGASANRYAATFELYDSNGNLIDTRTVYTGDNLKNEFLDKNAKPALATSIEVIRIAVESTTGRGFVDVTITTQAPKTIRLIDSKGYPYDSTATSGTKAYAAYITAGTSDANSLYSIEVRNSAEQWNSAVGDSFDFGPLFPTTSTQSLTGKTGTQATFLSSLPDDTQGKGYAKVEFVGFEDKPPRTEIEIGNKITGLDSSSKGGLQFRADNDFLRQIPFYLKLSDTNAGNTFTFEGKNVWYSMRFATGTGGKDTPFDYNVLVNSGDYVNGRQWIVGSNSITVLGISASDNFLSTGDIFNIDNVSYKINSIVNGRVSVSVDAAVQFRLYNYTGTLIYNTAGDTTDATYGLLFLSNNKTFDTANKLNIPEKIPVTLPLYTQESVRPVYYAVKYNSQTDKLFLLLDGDFFGSGQNDRIQYGKQLFFVGTSVPADDGVYTETSKTISHYMPKDSDFNAGSQNRGVYNSSNAFFVAQFGFYDTERVGGTLDTNTAIYIDTANGGNLGPFSNIQLSAYGNDVQSNRAYVGNNYFNLTSGTQSDYLKAGYTSSGTKVWLLDNDSGVKISAPQEKEKIKIIVTGKNGGFKEYLVNLNSGSASGDVEILTAMEQGSDANALSNAQLPHLYNQAVIEKVNGLGTNLTVKELIGVDVDAKFDTTSSIKDLVAKINSGKFSYKVTLGDKQRGLNLDGPIFESDANDDVKIVFFGKLYKLKYAKLTAPREIILEEISGATSSPSSGGSGSGSSSGGSDPESSPSSQDYYPSSS